MCIAKMIADEAATWEHSGNNFTFITIHVESSTSVHFPVLPFYIVPFGMQFSPTMANWNQFHPLTNAHLLIGRGKVLDEWAASVAKVCEVFWLCIISKWTPGTVAGTDAQCATEGTVSPLDPGEQIGDQLSFAHPLSEDASASKARLCWALLPRNDLCLITVPPEKPPTWRKPQQ